MRIVILTGFTSSSVVTPLHERYGSNDDGHHDFMGGKNFRPQIEDADVIVAVWPPDDRPIVIKAPEGVTIEAARWRHLEDPKVVASTTGDVIQAEIEQQAREWHDR